MSWEKTGWGGGRGERGGGVKGTWPWCVFSAQVRRETKPPHRLFRYGKKQNKTKHLVWIH